MPGPQLRVSEEVLRQLKQHQAKLIGKRGKAVSLRKFTEEMLLAGIKATPK